MNELKQDAVKEVRKQVPLADDMVYVTIPAEDLYDNSHPGVRLIGGSIKEWKDGKWVATDKAGTNFKFEGGRTYQVPQHIAIEIEDRLERFRKEQVRLLRPKTDSRSINQVNKNSSWSSQGGTVISLEGGLESLGGPNERVTVVNW